jgi:hypothetical protein
MHGQKNIKLSKSEFCEKRFSKINTLLKGVNEIFPYFLHIYPTWIQFGISVTYEHLLSDCAFPEYRSSDSH